MELLRKGLLIVVLLALPWQARWFSEGLTILSYPWEQGRWSFYLSWIVLYLFVVISIHQKPITVKKPSLLNVSGVALLLVSVSLSVHVRASIMWLLLVLHVLLLVWVLKREHVSRSMLIFWLSVGIVPHALLGLGQVIWQWSPAFSYLGLSELNPEMPGVSVVFHEGKRLLRAHGGLPHPNILGGWLAVVSGLMVITWAEYSEKQKALSYSMLYLFAITLAVTGSRSALMALIIVIVLALLRRQPKMAGTLFIGMMLAFWVFPHYLRPFSSSSQNSLEARSVNERVESLKSLPETLRIHWLNGVGPNAYLAAIAKRANPIIPHNSILLALVELGLLGAMGVGLLLKGVLKKEVIPLLAVLAPLVMLDHYLWSYWSGILLLVLSLGVFHLDQEKPFR